MVVQNSKLKHSDIKMRMRDEMAATVTNNLKNCVIHA
jgi:hypothetical protein